MSVASSDMTNQIVFGAGAVSHVVLKHPFAFAAEILEQLARSGLNVWNLRDDLVRAHGVVERKHFAHQRETVAMAVAVAALLRIDEGPQLTDMAGPADIAVVDPGIGDDARAVLRDEDDDLPGGGARQPLLDDLRLGQVATEIQQVHGRLAAGQIDDRIAIVGRDQTEGVGSITQMQGERIARQRVGVG